MKIVIAHLFYDLLNLYGESGNILALSKALTSQDIDVEIKNISLNDDLDLENVDFIYIGAGTESNLLLALGYLMKNKEAFFQAILSNKFFLITGNAIELLGKNFEFQNNEFDALNIFDFTLKKSQKRIVSECIFNYDKINGDILGFENHQSEISEVFDPLFTVKKGFGYNKTAKTEGLHKNNLYGTFLIGPILARNPNFLEYLCRKLILNKYKDFEFKPFNLEIERKAFSKFLLKYDK